MSAAVCSQLFVSVLSFKLNSDLSLNFDRSSVENPRAETDKLFGQLVHCFTVFGVK